MTAEVIDLAEWKRRQIEDAYNRLSPRERQLVDDLRRVMPTLRRAAAEAVRREKLEREGPDTAA
jgi:hypothetical protein